MEFYRGIVEAVKSLPEKKDRHVPGGVPLKDFSKIILYWLIKNPTMSELQKTLGLSDTTYVRQFSWFVEKVF